ncbi:MAG: hypothetical protein WCI72_03620 [archaeon]
MTGSLSTGGSPVINVSSRGLVINTSGTSAGGLVFLEAQDQIKPVSGFWNRWFWK